MHASVKDVAAVAGVAASTVSNYLNRPHLLSDKTRQKVESAIETVGFVPNQSARQLRAGSSKELALVLLDAWLPYFSDLSRGVEDGVLGEGWTLFFSNSARDPKRELANLATFEAHRVQGLIISPQGKVASRLEQLQDRGIECVVIGPTEHSGRVSSVLFDDVRGGELAGEHLVQLGRRRLAFLGNPHQVIQSADRLAGMVRATTKAGTDTTVMTVSVRDLTVEEGMDAARQILVLPNSERPDAVFAANDMVALGALTAFLRAGIRVPEDIAVVGFDDVAYASQTVVPLTSVRQPAYAMGRAAAMRLLTQIGSPGSRAVENQMFEPELVVRESTVGRRAE